METKKQKIVSAVATMGIVLMLFGATYAYFASRIDAGKTTDVEITANTVDVLTFETGDPITLSLDQENFASGKGNQSGSTFAKATLSANNKTNTATEHYYVYLYIEENTFVHTNDDGVPEILLRVTKNGTEITSGSYLDNIDYNGTNLIGYDFTDAEGLIPIAYEEITTTSTTEDVWNVEITFVNHDFDQSANAGQSFKGRIIIQKNEVSYHDLCDEDLLACYVAKQYTGTQGDNNIYYHNGTILNDEGTIMDAEDYSYRYAGAYEEVNNYVCFGSDEETCPVDNLYRIIGVFDGQVKLIKTTWTAPAEVYTLDFTNCLTDMACYNYTQKYKEEMPSVSVGARWNYTNATTAYNETGYYNVWSYSVLNTGFLNGEYLNNFDTKWSDKIATTDWIVGGNTEENLSASNAKIAYTNEIINPSTEVESIYQSKVGLMYASDYYYGATPTYWTYLGIDYSDGGENNDYRAATGSNWMYVGLYEWTITRVVGDYPYAFGINQYGGASTGTVNHSRATFYVRPVFYLNSDVTRASGDGTRSLPYRLS